MKIHSIQNNSQSGLQLQKKKPSAVMTKDLTADSFSKANNLNFKGSTGATAGGILGILGGAATGFLAIAAAPVLLPAIGLFGAAGFLTGAAAGHGTEEVIKDLKGDKKE